MCGAGGWRRTLVLLLSITEDLFRLLGWLFCDFTVVLKGEGRVELKVCSVLAAAHIVFINSWFGSATATAIL